jgi:hypothetical protein
VKDFISPTWERDGWIDSSYSVAKQPPGGNDCGICTVMFCRLLQMGRPLPLSKHGALTPRLMARLRSDFARQLVEGNFARDISLPEGM